MTARQPNHDWVDASAPTLREIALAYTPNLRFDAEERYFPILAEAYLSHASQTPWPEHDWADAHDLPAYSARRGTALCRGEPGDAEIVAGAPNAQGRPLMVVGGATDPDAMGNFAGPAHADLYLAFGGWTRDRDGFGGDAEYLYDAFSELAAAVNPAWNSWKVVGQRRNLPQLWIPQGPSPVLYAEWEWGGYLRTPRGGSSLTGPATLNPEWDDIDDYLCLTYYMLYAARVPSGDGDETRAAEGQWEAVSLFFKCQTRDKMRPTADTLDDLQLREPPEWVAVTQGPGEHGVGAEAKKWSDTQRTLITALAPLDLSAAATAITPTNYSTQVVLYVGRGTHRIHFAPIDGPWPPVGLEDADVALETSGGFVMFNPFAVAAAAAGLVMEGMNLVEMADFFFGGDPDRDWWEDILLGLAGLIMMFIAILFVFIILLIAFVIAVALFLLGLLGALFVEIFIGSDDPLPGPAREEGRGNLPEAGGETIAEGDVTTGEGAASPGAGSPVGGATAGFDVRVIDLLHAPAATTPYPSVNRVPPDFGDAPELPSWWDFRGEWGVRMPRGMATKWANGTRRIDGDGRSLAYFNAIALMKATSQ